MQYQISRALLTVRGLLHKNYQPYADLLAAEYQPAADWLNRELLPTLILLPMLNTDEQQSDQACQLALAMELSFLAGRVHDLTAANNVAADLSATGGQNNLTMASRAILVGDYLYTFAAMKLAQAGYNQWSARIGRTICRRSEAKLVRLRWPLRPYVAETEKTANLHKEHAEAFALAAEMSVAGLDWPDVQRQAWIDFGFFVGLAQGVLLTGGSSAACAEALSQAEQVLAGLPSVLCAAARDLILRQPDFQRGSGSFEQVSQTNIR